ncbi:MAG: TolC family protein, partial [Spirochaetota bacterium]
IFITNENPELKSIVQQRIVSEYALKSSKADYYPRVYGVAGVNRSGDEWLPDETRISAGLQMSLNIFQGGKSYYQINQAKSALNQLFADEKNTRTTIAYYLEQAWINLQNNIEQVKVQEKFLNAAIERAKITDAQYSIGSVLFDNWIVVQDNLVSARQKFLTVKTSALIAEAEWIQLKGEIVQ